MTTRAELSSVATGLGELTTRVTQIADELDDDERDSVGHELYEVERLLRSAERRLVRLLDRVGTAD
jgi:hypothetical protein